MSTMSLETVSASASSDADVAIDLQPHTPNTPNSPNTHSTLQHKDQTACADIDGAEGSVENSPITIRPKSMAVASLRIVVDTDSESDNNDGHIAQPSPAIVTGRVRADYQLHWNNERLRYPNCLLHGFIRSIICMHDAHTAPKIPINVQRLILNFYADGSYNLLSSQNNLETLFRQQQIAKGQAPTVKFHDEVVVYAVPDFDPSRSLHN